MKKVMMILYHYSRDPRPRRESEALLNTGYKIDMICLRHKGETKRDILHGVNLYRLYISKSRDSKIKYISLYLTFFLRTFLMLSLLQLRKKYDIIHIHNMPDFLVFTAILPKILGAKIILDMHDTSPEIYQTKYGLSENDRLIKFVLWQEKISIKFSDHIITTNTAFKERFISRGCPRDKISIVMNSPQESIFLRHLTDSKPEPEKSKFIIMCHGYIAERSGLDTAVRACAILKDRIPHVEFRVFGEGEFVQNFLNLVDELKLKDYVKYYGRIPIEQIAALIPESDLGIIPNKATPFTNINFPVRIFEYLFMKKPTIVPRSKGIKDYFNEDEIFYFNPGDAQDLSNVIMNIYSNPKMAKEKTEISYRIYQNHTWEIQKKYLLQIYDSLT